MYRKDLKTHWTSEDPSTEVLESLHREFPVDASIFEGPDSRRDFLKLMGASFALGGMNSCVRSPLEKIVSSVIAPVSVIPGKSIFFSRSLSQNGFGIGVLVESYMNRPIKIDGHPDHPMSLGASSVALQADILNFYAQDRIKIPLRKKFDSSWMAFHEDWKKYLIKNPAGEGLWILHEPDYSPGFHHMRSLFVSKFPQAQFISYDSIDSKRSEASELLFGRDLIPFFDFSKPKVILSFDYDFFSDPVSGLKYSRDFAKLRSKNKNRLYSVETDYSLTGAMADHRLARTHQSIQFLILQLAFELGVTLAHAELKIEDKEWIKSVAREFKKHHGEALIVGSEFLPPEVQALIYQMNEKLGAFQDSMSFVKSHAHPENKKKSDLYQALKNKKVSGLITLGVNPIYDSHINISKVPFTASLQQSENETTEQSYWVLPESHPLECWSDARSINGIITINQPLCSEMYDSKNTLEFLSLILDDHQSSHDFIKGLWGLSQNDWEKALRSGQLKKETVIEHPAFKKVKFTPPHTINNIELHLKADPYLYDGKFANNGWLQELPRPISKTCWGNVALLSPDLAKEKKLKNNDVVKISVDEISIEIPVWIQPGLADSAIIVNLGHGRKNQGKKYGTNAFKLLSEKRFFVLSADISKTGSVKEVACTQLHHNFPGTEPLRVVDLGDLKKVKKEDKNLPTLFPTAPIPQSEKYAWAMSIDLNLCNGCNACVIGCQSENNIPIVGEEQVKVGREMHWIRIDRYYEGPDYSKVHFQPMACVHCEKAPCEVVCPVGATNHNDEGLNQMVYNRCVGTRYCSNNCPYKVRRFNFLDYNDRYSRSLKLRSNPEVTVRSRGVMEKCSYCVQRISEAKINADLEDRNIRDGEIKTACQVVCPTQAITFGNLLDPKSEVSHKHAEAHSYGVLAELGTRPRTEYLYRVKNPQPDLLS